MGCRKNSPGNPCCVPLDPTCEEACETYADVVSYAVTVEGMAQDFLIDLFPIPEQPSCLFTGSDCFIEAIVENSSAETTRDETYLVDTCINYFSTCQDGFSTSYTQSQFVNNYAWGVMQQDRFDLSLTLRPVTGTTTTLRFTASLGYQRYVQICGFISFDQAYRTITTTVHAGMPATCTYGAWTFTPASAHPAFYLLRDPDKYQPDYSECPFDWDNPPTTPCELTYSNVGTFPTIAVDGFGVCTVSGTTDIFGIDPIWCDDWDTTVGEILAPPYVCNDGSFPATTFTVGFREFFYEYQSETFECDAFPSNPIELKRMPYTDVAATDNTYPFDCAANGETDMELDIRITTPAIPKSLYITI